MTDGKDLIMTDNIPQWAKERACELVNAVDDGLFIPADCTFAPLLAFARYIAEHEEPPVDPLLVAARELVAQTQHNWPDSPWHLEQVDLLLSGKSDRNLTVMAAYEGIKRGIELARTQSGSAGHD